MDVRYLILLILLFSFLAVSYYIHYKRTGNLDIASYRWFVKILK